MPSPPPINANPGDPAANAYVTQAQCDTYQSSRLFNDTWNNAASDDQIRAIEDATRRIDASFEWTGGAASITQRLCWPRTGMRNRNHVAIDPGTIPPELMDATCEMARQLLAADRFADNDAAKLGILNVRAGSVGVQFKNFEAGNNVDTRNQDIRRYSKDLEYVTKGIPDAVRNLLVKGWYRENVLSQPLIFEAGGGPEGDRRHRR